MSAPRHISSTGTLPIPVNFFDGDTPSYTYRRVFTPDGKGVLFVSLKGEGDMSQLDSLTPHVAQKTDKTRSWRLDRQEIEKIENAIRDL